MLSLNQLKQLFNNKKLNHAVLSSGTFLFDEQPEFGAASQITYPLMGVTVNKSNLDGNELTTEFNFVFCDLNHQDNSDKDNIMSNMHQCALDIYSQIRYDLFYYFEQSITENFELDPLVGIYDDDICGWGMTLTVKQFYDRSTCDLPDSGNHAGQVTIYNSDGSVAAYLNPNSTYTLNAVVTDTADSNANFSGTTFTLSHTPVFITGVFLNGQRLTLTTDYTVSGTTITFNNALANDIVVVVYSY